MSATAANVSQSQVSAEINTRGHSDSFSADIALKQALAVKTIAKPKFELRSVEAPEPDWDQNQFWYMIIFTISFLFFSVTSFVLCGYAVISFIMSMALFLIGSLVYYFAMSWAKNTTYFLDSWKERYDEAALSQKNEQLREHDARVSEIEDRNAEAEDKAQLMKNVSVSILDSMRRELDDVASNDNLKISVFELARQQEVIY